MSVIKTAGGRESARWVQGGFGVSCAAFWLERAEQCPDQDLTGITEDYMTFDNALGSGKFWKLVHFGQDRM